MGSDEWEEEESGWSEGEGGRDEKVVERIKDSVLETWRQTREEEKTEGGEIKLSEVQGLGLR